MAKLNSQASKIATLNIKDGLHHFKINRYKEFTTKNNDIGIAIGFDLADQEGGHGKCSDLFIINDKQQHRLMRLLEACGQESLWDKGEVTEQDLMGQEGFCEITIVENKDEKTKLQYPHEIKVSHYYVNGELEFSNENEADNDSSDDELFSESEEIAQ
ncbi:MAG: hypothetical protein O2809_00765 [Proteobacteria bacterium]|nr:hypothetical protein [Pseudomonadota bacterium]